MINKPNNIFCINLLYFNDMDFTMHIADINSFCWWFTVLAQHLYFDEYNKRKIAYQFTHINYN